MMKGEGDVVSGFKNKVLSTVASITPSGVLAAQHKKKAAPPPGKTSAWPAPLRWRGVRETSWRARFRGFAPELAQRGFAARSIFGGEAAMCLSQ
jgi:hypothetical protein